MRLRPALPNPSGGNRWDPRPSCHLGHVALLPSVNFLDLLVFAFWQPVIHELTSELHADSGSFYPSPTILFIYHTLSSHPSSCFFTLIPSLAYSTEPNNINYPLVNAHCDRYCCQPCIWINTISPHKKTMRKAELLSLRHWGTVRSSNSPMPSSW